MEVREQCHRAVRELDQFLSFLPPGKLRDRAQADRNVWAALLAQLELTR